MYIICTLHKIENFFQFLFSLKILKSNADTKTLFKFYFGLRITENERRSCMELIKFIHFFLSLNIFGSEASIKALIKFYTGLKISETERKKCVEFTEFIFGKFKEKIKVTTFILYLLNIKPPSTNQHYYKLLKIILSLFTIELLEIVNDFENRNKDNPFGEYNKIVYGNLCLIKKWY